MELTDALKFVNKSKIAKELEISQTSLIDKFLKRKYNKFSKEQAEKLKELLNEIFEALTE